MSAIITGMVSALGVGVVAVMVLQQSQMTQKQTRVPRVKSAMMQTELKLRQALSSSASFDACTVQGQPSICLHPGVGEAFNKPMMGAICPTENPGCGIKVENLQVISGQATAIIRYEGSDVSMEPIALNFTVPADLMASSTVCPVVTPIFKGWSSSGVALCGALPPNCGPGQYLKEIRSAELQMGSNARSCETIPAVLGCANPAAEYISQFSWNGGSDASMTCMAPQSAFDVFGDPTSYSYAVEPIWPTPTTMPPPPPPPPPPPTCPSWYTCLDTSVIDTCTSACPGPPPPPPCASTWVFVRETSNSPDAGCMGFSGTAAPPPDGTPCLTVGEIRGFGRCYGDNMVDKDFECRCNGTTTMPPTTVPACIPGHWQMSCEPRGYNECSSTGPAKSGSCCVDEGKMFTKPDSGAHSWSCELCECVP